MKNRPTRSTTTPHPLIVVAFAILVLAGCSNESEQTVTIIAPTDAGVAFAAQGPVDRAGGATLRVRQAGAFESFLVDGKGRSLYVFTPDEDAGESTCDESCSETWPPYLTNGEPSAVEPAVDRTLLDTVERDDGTVQVTYRGWPLYRYSHDRDPGDTAGHGVESFDGEWFLVSPDGNPIEATVESY